MSARSTLSWPTAVALALAASACDGSPAVGAYRFDVIATREELGRLLARIPKPQSEILRGKIGAMMNSLASTLIDLHRDGSFDGQMAGAGDALSTIHGTWTLHGSALQLAQTHRDGIPAALTLDGEFYGDSIHLVEGEGRARMEFVLRREVSE